MKAIKSTYWALLTGLTIIQAVLVIQHWCNPLIDNSLAICGIFFPIMGIIVAISIIESIGRKEMK